MSPQLVLQRDGDHASFRLSPTAADPCKSSSAEGRFCANSAPAMAVQGERRQRQSLAWEQISGRANQERVVRVQVHRRSIGRLAGASPSPTLVCL